MGTIINYIEEYGDYTFSEKPFGEVDSLILCQFAYLKFDGLVVLRDFLLYDTLSLHLFYKSLRLIICFLLHALDRPADNGEF